MTDHDPIRPSQPTEPGPDAPVEPRSPFDRPDDGRFERTGGDAPPPGGPRRGGTGVGKPLLIGGGILVLLGVVAVAALFFLRYDLLAWVYGTMETQVEARLPEDLSTAERERLDRAFDEAIAATREGRIDEADPTAIQRVQSRFMEISRLPPDQPMSSEQVAELAAALEAIPAGGATVEEP